MVQGVQGSVLALLAVTAAFCIGTSEAKSQSVRVTDPSLYWTAYNWYIPDNGSFAQTGNSGAYVKTTFSGSSFGVSFDFSGNPDDRYMTLRYSLDDGPWCDILLPCAAQVVIGSGLNTSTNHSVLIVIRNSRQDVDRWIKPLNYVRILSFEIDGDAKLYPPFIQPKRLLAFWDSIGEGVLTASDQGGDLEDNDSTVTWAFALASALGAELSVVAWGGQGWTKGGGANTPIFNNLVDQSLSGWSNFYFNQTRLVDGYLWPYPDYVVCGHGTNDMWASDQDVYYAANDWLSRIRAASGPSSLIFLVVPFGQYKAAALKQAFDTYQDNDPDPLTYFIDLGPQAAAGINNPGQPSMQAFEGLHPSYRRSPQLGAMLARAIVTSVR